MSIKKTSLSRLLMTTSIVFFALSGCQSYTTKQEMGKDIGAALGAGTNCGSCRPALASILAQAQQETLHAAE